MDLSPINIVMTTYMPDTSDGERRADAAMGTVQTWIDCLRYDDGVIRLIIADDGSHPDLLDLLHCYALTNSLWEVSQMRQSRRGVGASLNAGLQQAFQTSPLALYAVDDWLLTDRLDLTPWARQLLDTESNYGMIRLGPPHPFTWGEMRAEQHGWILRMDALQGGFVFGHRPALYHQRLFGDLGWFKEHVNAFECEQDYNERYCAYAHTDFDGSLPRIGYALPVQWQHHPASPEFAGIVPVPEAQ